jgi:hypothetical protein
MPSVAFRLTDLVSRSGSRRIPVAEAEAPWHIFGAFLSAECSDPSAGIHGDVERALRAIGTGASVQETVWGHIDELRLTPSEATITASDTGVPTQCVVPLAEFCRVYQQWLEFIRAL